MNNILMNVEMTKAIIYGRKTQSRRVVKCKNEALEIFNIMNDSDNERIAKNGKYELIRKYSRYKKDEVIWVREPAQYSFYDKEEGTISFRYKSDFDNKTIKLPDRLKSKKYLNKINDTDFVGCPNGCIKEMARIFLKITDVRVERLQDIGYGDIIKEGCPLTRVEDALSVRALGIKSDIFLWWINLWNKTAPKGYKWDDNPYVFVYEFERFYGDGYEN